MVGNACIDKLFTAATVHFLWAKWFVHAWNYKGFTCSNYKGTGEPDQTTILDKLFPFLVNASYTIKYNILISETIRWIQCQLEFKLLVVTSLARRRADSNSSLGMLWVRVRATLLLDVINLINPPRQQEIGTNCLWKGPNASGNH